MSNRFLDPEVRDGYKVTEKQKKVWAIELDLYQKFEKLCNENNIPFCTFAGTMLGAVRHKGFIPWDDDFDVCMTRENYNRFIEVSVNYFQYPYFLQTGLNDPNYPLGYARLRNSETTGAVIANIGMPYNNGIYIDIHVLDGKPEKDSDLKRQLRHRDKWLYKIYHFQTDFSNRVGIKRILHQIYQKYIKVKYNYPELFDNYVRSLQEHEDSIYIGLMTHPESFVRKYYCKKSDIEDTVLVDFEYLKVPIPCNYHEVLKNIYGDYMKFPPVKNRGQWHNGQIIFEPDIPYKDYLVDKVGISE